MFTNQCNEPKLSNLVPTVICSTMCVNLLEPDVEAGGPMSKFAPGPPVQFGPQTTPSGIR
uniref:Uncharacterized protein n=1 Tax=Setaria digitata TaxID=48799 RepID=A0A915PU17_9BILA